MLGEDLRLWQVRPEVLPKKSAEASGKTREAIAGIQSKARGNGGDSDPITKVIDDLDEGEI